MGRTLIQLYIQVLSDYTRGDEGTSICQVAKQCLDAGEFKTFISHFKRQRPSSKKHLEFVNNNLLLSDELWWPLVAIGRYQRIKFLKYMIKQLENAKANRPV